MIEAESQMRRSISMPAKPLQLEEKTLKRSAEKENVFESDEEEDNTNANYLRQGSSPAMVTESTECQNVDPTSTLHGVTKHIRSVRDFLANSMNPIFSIFRKFTQNDPNGENTGEETEGAGVSQRGETNGLVPQHLEDPNDKASDSQNGGQTKGREEERVVFSLS